MEGFRKTSILSFWYSLSIDHPTGSEKALSLPEQ
jgi:hypothetical protein